VPGLIDAHTHFLVRDQLELDDARDATEVQQRLARWAREHPAAEWILGRGWGYGIFEREPDKSLLDAVVRDRPVFLRDRDGHSALASSAALRLAGVGRDTRDPEGGIVVRDASGEPTGLLKESATGLVGRHVPEPTTDERYQALLKLMDRAAAAGLTSVQNASFDDEELPVWERALAEGRLKVRVSFAVPFVKDPGPERLSRYRALRDGHRGSFLRFGAVKGFLDGVIDARTAAMLAPYTKGGTGLPLWTQEDLDRTAALFDREGFQILLHACGDRAIRMALDAYERAAKTNGTRGRRHRVEHMEVPDPADLPRFAALGVIASTQATFANPDQTTLGNYAVLLGPERSARANAFRRIDDAGAVQAFGSDWPVFPMEPLRGLYIAVERMTPEGQPPGGWYPENRISAEAALRHFTWDAAYAGFVEDVMGLLATGKLADFVVLSDDVLEARAERLLNVRAVLTVMGGRVTFRGGGFPGPAR
jgi:predicted amidohydrolase YtcJ